MDLQQILSHRDICFICQEKLTYSLAKHPNLIFLTDDKSFRIRSGHKQGIKMDFNFDGSYQRNKRHYKIYQEPIIINKTCKNCLISAKDYVKDDLTIANIMSKEYHYSFVLRQQEDKYEVVLNYETARYRDDQQFFHIYNNHYAGDGLLHHSTFDKRIDDILNLRLASPINLSSVNNVDDYVKKCKTLINFS